VGEVKELKATDFILSIFPKNAVEALATNNILQILVFSIFAGVALSAIGERGQALVKGADALAEMMLQVTGYVMRYAPVAVFGALANVVAASGLAILGPISPAGRVLFLAGAAVGDPAGRRRAVPGPAHLGADPLHPPAADDRLLDRIVRSCAAQAVRTARPLRRAAPHFGLHAAAGLQFNLDGSMMYMSFATIFIAQAYGMDLSVGTQIMILLTLMISSKGIAAVPRASLVVITGTLAMFGLPVEGVAIILAIDQFLDMGRTATNVVGNAVATAVITKWEGMLEVEEPEYVEHPHAPAHTAADGRAGLELDESNFEDGKG
jgi:Na+/H+-dicarboxylate symporter